jgi:hypothetical protein
LVVSTSTQTPGKNPQLEIQRMLNEWQSRLELTTWRIDVHLVPPGSLGSDENGFVTVADIDSDRSASSATIRVEQSSEEETEESLIHELIHLKLEAWQPPAENCVEEQTVDTIAFALLRSRKDRRGSDAALISPINNGENSGAAAVPAVAGGAGNAGASRKSAGR